MNVPSPAEPGSVIAGGGAPIPYPADLGQTKPLPVYFGFTVTGTLAKPIVRPAYQAGGADTSGAGGGPYGGGGPMMSGGPAGSGGPMMSGAPGGSGGPYMSGGPPGK
jgi:hypothetical protein